MKEIQATQHNLENEKQQRLERDASFGKKLSDEVFRLQERLDQEILSRESVIAAMKEDIEKYNRSKERSDERFAQRMLEEIEVLKNGLRIEAENRERSEDTLAATLQDVVVQLQQGLRIASSR
jgi:hypothetical protein